MPACLGLVAISQTLVFPMNKWMPNTLLSRQDTIFVVTFVFLAGSLELLSAHYKFTGIQFIVAKSPRSPSGSERFIYGYQTVVAAFCCLWLKRQKEV